MTLRRIHFTNAFLGTIVYLLSGCAQKADQPPAPANSQKEAAAETARPADGEPAKPSPESAPVEASHTPTEPDLVASNKVTLGDPSLTAGIPGNGPLTLDQLRAWLDDPRQHEVLQVELPLGLKASVIPPGVLESNPLTRAKIELGRQLYFDTRLSADNTVSCASCHHPDEGWARHTQFGEGIGGQKGNRNSPVSYNRIFSKAQFWDGRAASLEEQAIGPIANPIEMGNTHEKVVDALKAIPGYRLQFEKVFGEEGITIENVGRAIASFERVVVTGPSPYDYYERLAPLLALTDEDFADDPDLKKDFEARQADAKAHPMSESAIRGRKLFFLEKINCAQCHLGANFSDEIYHNLGVGMQAPEPDVGRYAVSQKDPDRGAFKTPTIRNVALTAPYMHDGSQKTLLEVVEHYNKGGTPNPHLSPKIKKLDLSEQDKLDLVAFMEACTGDFPKIETGRLPE